MKKAVVLAVSVTILLSLAATAQEARSEIGVQGAGLFTSSLTANGTGSSATESAGIIGTYRHHLNHWISVEAGYGYSRNTQKYTVSSEAFRVQTGINQLTGSLVVGLPSTARLKPYFLMGGGAMVFTPTSNEENTLSGAQTQTKGAFVYGLGVNYGISRRLSLRAEYRGLVFSTPDFGFGALTTDSITQTAEPSIGVVFRF